MVHASPRVDPRLAGRAHTGGFDVAVVGGGAGGIAAAQTAARLGGSTLLVQDGPIGGDCTFTGCVPSKALLEAAAAGVGFEAAMSRVRAAIGTVAGNEDDDAMARHGIAVRHGRGVLRGSGVVEVDGQPVPGDRIILATGSRPVLPRIDGLDRAEPLTNETVFDLARRPRSLAILGGGPIGCELAQAFARLGTTVTIVEVLDRLLPREEPEASEIVARALAADGVTIRTGTTVAGVELVSGGARLHLGSEDRVEAERVLVAVGRVPATAGLGLYEAGVAVDEGGFIGTADTMATNVGGIWAVGDVTGRLPFTHAAAHMGRIAAHNALDRWARIRPRRFDTTAVPWVTFTDPEVAHVGLTETEAADRGGRVAVVPFDAFDRAIAAGRTDGYFKLIAGPRRLLGNIGGAGWLGATAVGPRGGELVHEVALGIRTGMFAGWLAQTVHAYPTWSIAVQLAAAQLFMDVDGRGHRPAARS